MFPANTLLPVFALLRIPGAAFQNWGVHKLLSARLLLRLSECFLHESMQKTYIFSCFDCDLIARHPYSLLSCPPIEVHHRRNTAFITVLVVETDDCTTVLLIGAPNAFHARDAHDFIGRCTTERAFPAFRFNVCFHFFSSNLLQNSGGSSKGGISQKLQTYLQHTSFFALLKRRWAHLSHSGAFLLGISDARSTPVA